MALFPQECINKSEECNFITADLPSVCFIMIFITRTCVSVRCRGVKYTHNMCDRHHVVPQTRFLVCTVTLSPLNADP